MYEANRRVDELTEVNVKQLKSAWSRDEKPGPDIKTKYEKDSFGDFLSADFWQKTLRVNKIAMKSFSKYLSFGVDFKLVGPYTDV